MARRPCSASRSVGTSIEGSGRAFFANPGRSLEKAAAAPCRGMFSRGERRRERSRAIAPAPRWIRPPPPQAPRCVWRGPDPGGRLLDSGKSQLDPSRGDSSSMSVLLIPMPALAPSFSAVREKTSTPFFPRERSSAADSSSSHQGRRREPPARPARHGPPGKGSADRPGVSNSTSMDRCPTPASSPTMSAAGRCPRHPG